ncbi:succinyl-diaminopimelate desuccinylase [Marmoricola endophyticus]|uniref:Succinyl-diaminopimelate desuccinylase n=1 Tax=Marmoricola endophyticus TaxID=2040280 RepID=A0A917BQB1_9ACTN|nr:succinyl-diaminopimelate desuccinylase [Marmoricola endophyticus]GGF53014.1 succinyl-diaminopimelate desuccinylase [Marmoricola endophyticus]
MSTEAGPDALAALDLELDVVSLTEQLCNVESVSRHEQHLADLVHDVLLAQPHLRVERSGNAMVARTELGRDERVVVAGHLDTVPVAGNLPVRRDDEFLHGVGTSDMKGGVAVALLMAAHVPEPVRDVTYVFYDCEEIEAEANGLRRIAEEHPEVLACDFAILMESSDAEIEAGCQGTLRVEVTVPGQAAHSARAWRGENAVHRAGELLQRLADFEPRRPVVDGLEYHEGLNAVLIEGGTATNVIPPSCTLTVNYRFAPDRSEAEALAFVQDFFAGYDVRLTDTSPGARPGLDRPAVAAFAEAIGGAVRPKYGWTDVARFSTLGIPAVNYGPGDASFAHRADERVPIAALRRCERAMRSWLTGEDR